MHAPTVQLNGKLLSRRTSACSAWTRSDRLLVRLEARGGEARPRRLDAGRRARDAARPPAGTERHHQPATDLTVGRVQDSFASPDTLLVWTLPDFIALLERSGFSAIRHRLHFQALLALPLLAGTMALVSAGFTMRATRRGGVAQMIGSGVAAGFALFVVSKVAEEFGQSGALPAGAGGLGAGRRRADAGRGVAAAPRGRLSLANRLPPAPMAACAAALLAGVALCGARRCAAQAQFGARSPAARGTPPAAASDDPVAFTADQVEYDRDNGLVTATGNVEAWQNDHVLRADKITFDRNTNVAAAQRPRRDDGAGRPGAVQRLCRADRGHARRRAARHAGASWRRTASWSPTAPAAPTARSTS